MDSGNEPIQALKDIKQIMDRSSRFVSLSGWSGIAAGICALAAAWLARKKFEQYSIGESEYETVRETTRNSDLAALDRELLLLGLGTFVVAFFLAFLFTYLRSRKTGVPIWGFMARKIVFNAAIPFLAGALLIWRMADFGFYGLIIPACLIFYGLSLINVSKFTLSEVRYLGYLQLLLGFINLWAIGYGLLFWAAGFGILHILYGIVMWNKYERNEKGVA